MPASPSWPRPRYVVAALAVAVVAVRLPLVRVRDPQLSELVTVLRSAARPTWVVAPMHGVRTWGISAAAASRVERELHGHYDVAHSEHGLQVWRAHEAPAGAGPASRLG